MNGRFLLILILLILWFILGWFFFKKYICNLGVAAPAAATTVVPKEKAKDVWEIEDGNKYDVDAPAYFQFRRSNFNAITPAGVGAIALDRTSQYLKKNNDRSLLVTGYYDKAETNNSILGNLGLARANSIKKLLMAKGVSGGQIEIASAMSQSAWFLRDTLRRGAIYAFSGKKAGNNRVAEIKKRLVGKPLTLYFGTNQDQINLTAQQRTDFTDMIYYLDNVSAANLSVGGHTDNVGNRDYNVNLSKNRAEFVKGYLKKNGGISDGRMNVNGFGPDKPVSSNATSEGKAKNRRVEVTLN